MTEPTRLARRLGLVDAVVIGLGSMIGAGVFAAVGPAARVAGNALLIGLVVAGAVAYCNATSSAQLAAVHPRSGGTYVYGRERLGRFWGYLAGWAFVVGKIASCAAMATTFASYVSPALARPLAVGAVLALTAVNCFGIEKTALVTRVLVLLVLASLACVIVAALGGGQATVTRLWPLEWRGPYAVLQSAGLLFFAFAGYARIATLGEEVVSPERTIPRAIPLALAITLVVYATVLTSALAAVGASTLGAGPAPLAAAVEGGTLRALAPVVRVGAAFASIGVLLSLMLGVSRTVFAMAADHELPRWLAAVHPRWRVPQRAEVIVGVIVAAVAAVTDLRGAIGFSSFAVLGYYAITNAAALTLPPGQRRSARGLAVAGLVGCVVVAVTLPLASIAAGAAVLAAGAAVHGLRRRQ
jgi:APA family basic amino acid/polyamine antiporter